jgi:indole-3-glycerol phosphate synthase
MSILQEIFAHKRGEVAQRQRILPLEQVREQARRAAPPLDFVAALRDAPVKPALIAEIKFASPSRGRLVSDGNAIQLARLYQENGAAAISVLTDERYFQGSLDYLRQAASLTPRLPLLRKDFLYHAYQVYEAREAGADAVLLIVAGLKAGALRRLHDLVRSLGMAPLVEVHNAAELDQALSLDPLLIGINNRDLHNFTTQLETTLSLRRLIPSSVCVVSESGIQSSADVARLARADVDAILVGEALVTAQDIGAQVRSLAGQAAGVPQP